MTMSEPKPLFHVTKEGKNFTMENCEIIDHGSNRPIIKTDAEGTRVIGTKITYTARKFVEAVRAHPIRAAVMFVLLSLIVSIVSLIIEYHFFVKSPVI